jgi:hypothetical protein
MPPVPPTKDGKVASDHLGPYPDKLSRQLRVTLFPLGTYLDLLLPAQSFTVETQHQS